MIQTFRTPEHLLDRPVRIKLVGVGGTGSQLADALASLEVTLRALGHPGFQVQMFDGDRVTRASVGRSRYTRSDLGQYKVSLLAHRINLFYGLDWKAIPHHLDAHDAQCHLLITCTDSATTRAAIGKRFAKTNCETIWQDVGNGPSVGQLVCGHLGRPTPPEGSEGVGRLPNVFDLFPELADMSAVDREAPSCSVEEAITRQEWPINRVLATHAANLLWNLFRKGELQHHGCFVDTTTLTTRPLPVDPEAWAMFGYNPNPPKRRSSPQRKAA